MMVYRIFFILAVTATASRLRTRQGPSVSPKCKEEVKSIQTKEKAAAVGACEEKAQYPQKAIAHLQKGDRVSAIKTIEESFQTCAKFSESCAKELAPQVIQQIEFSGAAVSPQCKQSVAKVQKDQNKMKEVMKCEKDVKVVEKVLVSLNKDDLKSAVDAAHTGLEKCMGLSDQCADQLAPVVVNQVVMRALMEAQKQQGGPEEVPMTTVFARASATVLASKPADKLSLIGAALDQRALKGTGSGTVTPKQNGVSLLQRARLPKRFVSRMIMQFA